MDNNELSEEQKARNVLEFYLYTACKNKDVESVKSLLAQGATPNADRSSYWETGEYEQFPALIAAFPSVEIVRLLLEAGANPNLAEESKGEKGVYKTSALSYALAYAKSHPEDTRYAEIAELLRKYGGREEDIWPKSGGLPRY